MSTTTCSRAAPTSCCTSTTRPTASTAEPPDTPQNTKRAWKNPSMHVFSHLARSGYALPPVGGKSSKCSKRGRPSHFFGRPFRRSAARPAVRRISDSAASHTAGFVPHRAQRGGQRRDDMTCVGISVYITQGAFDTFCLSNAGDISRYTSKTCIFRRLLSDYVNGKLEQFAKNHIVLAFQIW